MEEGVDQCYQILSCTTRKICLIAKNFSQKPLNFGKFSTFGQNVEILQNLVALAFNEAVESKLFKLETSRTIIIPLTVSVLWVNPSSSLALLGNSPSR